MRALDRVTAILEVVAANRGSMTASAAAASIGLSLSTTSRMMHELADVGLLERTSSGAYQLGGRLIAIARAAYEPQMLLAEALPLMEALRDLTNETVSLHVRSQDRRVCIAEVQSHQPVRRVVPPGFSVPLHYGATGEALLAGLSPNQLADYVASAGLSVTDAEKLQLRVLDIQRDGWGFSVDGWTDSVSGQAASIRHGQKVIAALAVSGPSSRLTAEVMRGHAEALCATADKISLRAAMPFGESQAEQLSHQEVDI